MPFNVRFGPRAATEILKIRKFDQVKIRDAINRFLIHTPTKEQGSHVKALEQPAISQFRLRIGDYRVYYDVDNRNFEVWVIRIVYKGTMPTEEATQKE